MRGASAATDVAALRNTFPTSPFFDCLFDGVDSVPSREREIRSCADASAATGRPAPVTSDAEEAQTSFRSSDADTRIRVA
jgi:hypothetical protein